MYEDDLVIISTTIGAEFIGSKPSFNEDYVVIQKARRIAITQEGMRFYPGATVGASETGLVRFYKQNIVFISEASKEIADYYVQETSGIQLARGRVDR